MITFSQVFFEFVAWGPYALPDDRIRFINTTDSKATKKVTRAAMRKEKVEKTNNERECNTSAVRVFSTDQRISIEQLNVQKETMIERKNERTIIGLSIEMSAITLQVEAAKNRAESRCPEYNASNIMWKKVDYLLEEQERVMLKSSNLILLQ